MVHYTYKITNNINGKIYIGVHSTNDIDDEYMGSSIPLKKDIQKFGKENFTKQILDFFNSRNEALIEEARLVNDEFVKRPDTYNINTGGKTNTTGLVPVRDIDGNTMMVRKDDPRYLSGELKHVIKGKKYNFSQEELKRRSEQGKSNANRRHVTNGIINKSIPKEKLKQFLQENPDWWQGQTQHWTQQSIEKNLSGIGHKKYKERKQKERLERQVQILKIREENKKRGQIWINNGKKNLRIYKDERINYPDWTDGFLLQRSEEGRNHIIQAAHNANGKVNITVDGKFTKIKKEDLENFIKEHPQTQIGWIGMKKSSYKNGSKGYKWMNKDGIYKYISPQEQQLYIEDGWKFGYKSIRVKNK